MLKVIMAMSVVLSMSTEALAEVRVNTNRQQVFSQVCILSYH